MKHDISKPNQFKFSFLIEINTKHPVTERCDPIEYNRDMFAENQDEQFSIFYCVNRDD